MRRRIEAGELTGRLPGEFGLAADYRVGHKTIRRVLGLLREAGLVETQPGVGSRVLPPGERGG